MYKSKHTVMEVAYKILLNDMHGELIEYADEDNPLQVVLGKNDLIPGFEEGLKGRGAGPFSFVIDQDKAFGPRHEELVTQVSKKVFEENDELREDLLYVGNRIPMIDNRQRKVVGTVLQIRGDEVVMDFNHPLAGKTLVATGEILSIRQTSGNQPVPAEDCGCGSGCGCSAETEIKEEEEFCETCGNPSDKMGQGLGACQCG